MKKSIMLSLALTALFLAGACASGSHPMAMAMLTPISGSHAQGTVHFEEMNSDTVDVSADITGLEPGSVHGFHVHDKGDCSDNGNAAGGHFNPTAMPHGAPEMQSHHAGDFGNVTADDKGEVHLHMTTHSVTVTAGPNSVGGHALIIHANPDDLTTQPSGNAGPRIACGVVTWHVMTEMQH
jgi:Cu-Zn family superoxide dismutase